MTTEKENIINDKNTKGGKKDKEFKRSMELAQKIMKEVGLPKKVIQSFKNGRIVRSRFMGMTCDINANDVSVIKKLDKWGLAVYHVIHDGYSFGSSASLSLREMGMEMTSYLYVLKDISKDVYLSDEDIECDQKCEIIIKEYVQQVLSLAKQGCVSAYVVNKTYNIDDMGDIVVKAKNGGLVRIG